MLDLRNCSDGSGGCIIEPHWDPVAEAIIGIAIGYPNSSSNAVVWVDPNNGRGTMAVAFPGRCGVLAGATALDGKARTLIATLQCHDAYQIYQFDLESREMVQAPLLDEQVDALEPLVPNPFAANWPRSLANTAPVLGFGDPQDATGSMQQRTKARTSLFAVDSPHKLRALSPAWVGLPSDGTTAYVGSTLFVQLIRVLPDPPVFVGIDLLSGATTLPVAVKDIYDDCYAF